jgi:hypothetical protein
MDTTFDVVPDRAYFRVRYVTRNSRGDIQKVGTALNARFDTEPQAQQAATDLAEGR